MIAAAAEFISDLADQAIVLPAAAVIAVVLAGLGWRRVAIVWSLAIAGTFGLVLALKLAFGACGHLIGDGSIESPSGHTAAAGVFYGSLLALIGDRLFGRGLLAFALIVLVVALIGASRVVLGAHTVPEVLMGAAVGLVGALMMIRTAGTPPRSCHGVSWILLPVLAIVILFHGMHLPAEAAIRQFAATTWPLSACR